MKNNVSSVLVVTFVMNHMQQNLLVSVILGTIALLVLFTLIQSSLITQSLLLVKNALTFHMLLVDLVLLAITVQQVLLTHFHAR
jgi:hypothetical protein